MAKAKKNYVTMGCNECKNRNYYINKSRGKTQQPIKLELNKYCRYCKKHTLHKETK